MPPKGHKPGCRCNACKFRPLTLGYPNHEPGCRCSLCTACRREAQAESRPDRAEAPPLIAPATNIETGPRPPNLVINPDALGTIVSGDREQTARARVATWLAFRAQNPELSTYAIAREMRIHPNTLNGILSRAVREGWLKFDDPLERLEHEIIPKTVDTLSEALNDGDRKVALETAKATIFRQYLDAKGVHDAPQTVLALKIETAPTDTVKVLAGHVLGTPRVIDAAPVIAVDKES